MIGTTPEVTGEASQQPSSESSDVQAIVISDSHEMGFHGQSTSETGLSVDFRRGLSNSYGGLGGHSLGVDCWSVR